MPTIDLFVNYVKSIFASIPKYRINSFEHAIFYHRKDGMLVEMSITHIPNVSGDAVRKPFLALCARKYERNPNCAPNAILNLSMEEARLLRDFLNYPEVNAYLDEEA